MSDALLAIFTRPGLVGRKNWIRILLFISLGHGAFAQLTVTFPATRAVFQRDNANQSTLYIGGGFSDCLDQVEARVVPRVAGQGTATGWTVIQVAPSGGQFYGTLVVSGGWYNLEVRGILGGNVTGTSTVERVGVGEVFLVGGPIQCHGGRRASQWPQRHGRPGEQR